MIFNDATNINNGLIQECEFWTGLGYGAISGDTTRLKEFTGLLNKSQDYYLMMLLEAMDEFDFDDPNYADYPVATFNLVANQEDYPITSLTNKLLKVKRLELKLDGTNWDVARPLDDNESQQATDSTTINNQYSPTDPRYDLKYNAIFLRPIPTASVTNGGKLIYDRNVELFSVTGDDSKEPAFDRPFHSMVAKRAALMWAIVKDKAVAKNLSSLMVDDEQKFIVHYGTKQKQRQYALESEATLEDFE